MACPTQSLSFHLDDQAGIERVHTIHKRAYDADGESIEEGHRAEFSVETVGEAMYEAPDTDDSALGTIGGGVLTLIHPVGTPLDEERLMQAVCDAMPPVTEGENPSTIFQNPTIKIQLYQHGSSEKDVTDVFGEPWEFSGEIREL